LEVFIFYQTTDFPHTKKESFALYQSYSAPLTVQATSIK